MFRLESVSAADIALEPGGDIDLIQDGESLDFTESALNLEKLIGAFIHGSDVEGD